MTNHGHLSIEDSQFGHNGVATMRFHSSYSLHPLIHLITFSPFFMADSILWTVHADADLYKKIGMCARLFASFGCSSKNGSDS